MELPQLILLHRAIGIIPSAGILVLIVRYN